jgi:hypothetical protein
MADESTLRTAVARAWAVHLATHEDIDPGDYRRCSLERHLAGQWQAGENDPEELTCLGLTYLARLKAESY